ncbi:hypothetical protein CMQ_7908 [Grosmannia clavigera kw1407]|uniref:2EXR domain-containing protein n=1 Tax=Grosmannia clavigera (strain kw1407 / UAMH 11150) TaxID=655863 RepID=F0XRQ0_GROCL|nr:uncharacterized protein CMQ_7908 [Grosmannia clavigera kw1407]EFW99540.1 hypothetical protein CMQ_7908 [Grosmannia clavigera kw1407]
MTSLSPSFIFRRANGSFGEVNCDPKDGEAAIHGTMANDYQGPRPRNVDRPYRNEDDEPSDCIYFLRRLRQSIYSSGPDRTHCSACAEPICHRQKALAGNDPDSHDRKAYHSLMMSPERVLRDLVTNNAVKPLKQAVAETLLEVFGQSLPADPDLTLPPPSSVCPATPTAFPYFSALPFEIRRMIWDLAMPSRVLVHSDLIQPCDQGIEGCYCPQPPSSKEPWRPDLFYTCFEARNMVESYACREELPQKTGILSEARLVATLDVVYFPWLGTQVAMAGKNTKYSTIKSSVSDGFGLHSILKSLPYGKWTYQLRTLLLPLPTVALDVGWIDKQHADTLAWIAGVDLEDEDGDVGGTSSASTATAASTALSSSSYLKHLQVVVADILVPVSVRLYRCSPAQRQLLLQSRDGDIPDLAGKDFTVLVDLYDDWRIDEVLSLQTEDPSSWRRYRHGSKETGWQTGLAGRIVNKAACHRCIQCTRTVWEARDWGRFGLHLGQRLQTLCRPMIVFSVILEFTDWRSEERR